MNIIYKTLFKFFTVAFLMCIFSMTLCAQTIKGKVTDAATGEPLVGATVKLKGTKYFSLVKLDGSYIFKNLPAGTYTIVSSYQGYKGINDKNVITITTTETKTLNFLLQSNSTELESVTISSVKTDKDAGARRLEKIADPLLNILSAKTIELLPDITVANALQRVSGVTIEKSSSGEGRYPIIRGMEKRYINTLVNGIKIPSPDNKNRFIPLDLFPSELLERLEVSKSLTPSMEGDAIGGTINLVMKDAPVNKLFHVNIAGGYNNIFGNEMYKSFNRSTINRQSPAEINGNNYEATAKDFSVNHLNYTTRAYPINSNVGISYGNRFGKNKKIGILVSGSYQNQFRGTSSTFFLPNAQPGVNNIPQFVDLQTRLYSLNSKRLGINTKFDYKFNEQNKISLISTYAKLSDYQVRQVSDTIVLNSLIDEWYRSTMQLQSIYNSTLQGNHQITTSFKIDWSLGYSYAKNELPDQSQFIHEYPVQPTPGVIDAVQTITHLWLRNSDKDVSAYVNFSKKLTLAKRDVEIKTGGLYRDKKRDNFYNQYSFKAPTQVYTNINNATFKIGSDGIPKLNGNNYIFTEKIIAGYLQGKIAIAENIELLGGVRVENTDQHYDSQYTDSFKFGRIWYTDILPSAQIKIGINKKQSLRFSYYKALARPGFAELIPDGPEGEYFKERGNPAYLNHTTSNNFDVRYEFFPKGADQVLLGVFYKQINDPIEITAYQSGVTTTSLKPINLGIATNYGFEAVFTKYFGVFGVSANYTYTQSNITNDGMIFKYRNDAGSITTKTISETRPLQGQSNHIANVSLIYKNPKIGFDLQVAYVYTGERIALVSPYAGLHYWQQPISQLDISFEKKIVKKFAFYCKINNLTNTPLVVALHKSYTDYLQSPGARPALSIQDDANKIFVQKDFYKTSFLFGFRLKL